MGKPTGFMEYQRELPSDRSPLKRLEDRDEFHDTCPKIWQNRRAAWTAAFHSATSVT